MGTVLSKNNGKSVWANNPEQFLMELLVEKTRQAGHIISFKEASQDPEMVEPNNYAPYFGSFSEATKIAWRKAKNPQQETNTSQSSPVMIPKTKKPPEIGKKPKFFKFNDPDAEVMPIVRNRPNNSGTNSDDNGYLDDGPIWLGDYGTESRTQKYSYEKIKGIIIAFYKRNGRLPTSDDTRIDPNLPSAATIHKYLGGKREWEKLIPPSLRESNNQSNNSFTSKVDERNDHAPVLEVIPAINEPLIKDRFPATDESPVVEETPTIIEPPKEEKLPYISFDTEPTIIAKHHWEGETIVVEVKIHKPGNKKPVLITLTV